MPNDPKRVKCLVCSSDFRTVDILVTSVPGHRKAPKHISALTARTTPTSSGPSLLPLPIPIASAVMLLADRYGDEYNDSTEDMPLAGTSQARTENPFVETISYGGEILDAAGGQVLFSAGQVPVPESLESNNLWTQMEDLEYCDHTVFADMSPMMADLFDKMDDCTVSDAVWAMAAMGKLDKPQSWTHIKICDSGIDDSDEEDADTTGLGDFNNDWAPHRSKSVCR